MTYCFDTLAYCNTIISVISVSTSMVLSHYIIISVVRTFKISSLSNFELCSADLLTITMLCVGFSEFTHLLTPRLYTLANISQFSYPPDTGNHRSRLWFFEFSFFRFLMSDTIQYLSLC